MTRGVEDSFAQKDIDLHIEYMDTKQFFNSSYLETLQSLLREKHSAKKYDVIITSDNNAFSFYRDSGREIFGNTPIVFCGLNYVKEEDLLDLNNITGINEKANIEKNLKLIERIHSNVERILIISDDTTTGIKIQDEVKRIEAGRDRDKAGIELVHNISAADLRHKLENLSDDTIVYLTVFSRDNQGEFFEFDQGAQMISKHSPVPVYGT